MKADGKKRNVRYPEESTKPIASASLRVAIHPPCKARGFLAGAVMRRFQTMRFAIRRSGVRSPAAPPNFFSFFTPSPKTNTCNWHLSVHSCTNRTVINLDEILILIFRYPAFCQENRPIQRVSLFIPNGHVPCFKSSNKE